ncbi:MAG: CD3324 family protein [Bacillota bacterium]
MARYQNAADILPPRLLAELQHYAAGEQLYIPRPSERLPWGARSGARADLAHRNERIRRRWGEGVPIDELMREFHLGYDSIRKIVHGKNGSTRSRG